MNPNNAEAHFMRGAAYEQKGDHQMALVDYDEGIRLKPRFLPYYIERGRVCTISGDYEKAIANYTDALNLYPDQLNVYPLRAAAYKAIGEIEKANADYNEFHRRQTTLTSSAIFAAPTPALPEQQSTDGPLHSVFPQSNSSVVMTGERYPETRIHLLSIQNIRGWNDAKLRYAINEMYARHGADFKNKDIKKWFLQFDWYHPQLGLNYDEAENDFTDIEKQNLKLLGDYRTASKENLPNNPLRNHNQRVLATPQAPPKQTHWKWGPFEYYGEPQN